MKKFLSILALTLVMGVAQAEGPWTYSESVTSTVVGSSPTDTYSAKVAELSKRLLDAAKSVRGNTATGEKTIVLTRNSPLVSDMIDAAVQLTTIAGMADTAINALGMYSQKSFYENAPAQSKAAEDQGKHAAWVLRTIVPGST